MEPEGSLPCSHEPPTGPIPSQMHLVHAFPPYSPVNIWGCIQKLQDWPPGARTANGTAFCT